MLQVKRIGNQITEISPIIDLYVQDSISRIMPDTKCEEYKQIINIYTNMKNLINFWGKYFDDDEDENTIYCGTPTASVGSVIKMFGLKFSANHIKDKRAFLIKKFRKIVKDTKEAQKTNDEFVPAYQYSKEILDTLESINYQKLNNLSPDIDLRVVCKN